MASFDNGRAVIVAHDRSLEMKKPRNLESTKSTSAPLTIRDRPDDTWPVGGGGVPRFVCFF